MADPGGRAGLAGRSPAGAPAYAGWEDAAVPPDRMGPYLRDFDALLTDFGITGLPYGHFADGCLHIRLDLPLDRPDGSAVFRRFLTAAAELVARYDGSLSGEHGDGRARSELLPLMYSPEALRLFGAVKHIFDPATSSSRRPRRPAAGGRGPARPPDGAAAPGPRPRLPRRRRRLRPGRTPLHGCRKCRADTTGAGGVMCPSYLATREEQDSTRGRARVLQEMVNGSLVRDGWRSAEVHVALDLCLSCKGCASDCPTGVDMASWKAEVLHQSYRRRLRPASHYSLGCCPGGRPSPGGRRGWSMPSPGFRAWRRPR